MTSPGLFAASWRFHRGTPAGVGAPPLPPLPLSSETDSRSIDFGPSAPIIDIFQRVENPDDPFALRDLYLARVEHALGASSFRSELAELWRSSRPRRVVEACEILNSRAAVRFVKETFNHFFRDDLYGQLRDDNHIIMSSGAVDEQVWGLPTALKECISFALERDWYGYSDSRGREPARAAVGRYETTRLPGVEYTASNVALTMGGTFAANCIADMVLTGRLTHSPALCAIPNYPPLVESVARRAPVQLVPTPLQDGMTTLSALIDQLRPDTPLVLLQTVTNPTGARVHEGQLAALIGAASPATVIVLDECHEWLGTPTPLSAARGAANVVRLASLSKGWSAPGVKLGWILADAAVIDTYYEYASTSFGGPPSLYYTAAEVLARMERWRHDGVSDIGTEHLAEFETGYGLRCATLQAAYTQYSTERDWREAQLLAARSLAASRLAGSDAMVVGARYSINSSVTLPDCDNSYLEFRRLLAEEGVAVFPGLLTFCLSEDNVRVTTSRRPEQLIAGLSGMRSYLDRRRQGLSNGRRPTRCASAAASSPPTT